MDRHLTPWGNAVEVEAAVALSSCCFVPVAFALTSSAVEPNPFGLVGGLVEELNFEKYFVASFGPEPWSAVAAAGWLFADGESIEKHFEMAHPEGLLAALPVAHLEEHPGAHPAVHPEGLPVAHLEERLGAHLEERLEAHLAGRPAEHPGASFERA